jgi:hypothetical protein
LFGIPSGFALERFKTSSGFVFKDGAFQEQNPNKGAGEVEEIVKK